MIKLNLPTWLSVALAVLAGVLSVLNLTTFGFVAPWQEAVTIGLSVLASLGIAPLTGTALRNVLHISHATALVLASLFATASLAVTTLSIDTTTRAIIVGILALISGVLFGPGGTIDSASAPVAPRG